MIPSSDNDNSTGQGAATATADHPLIHLLIAKGYDGKGKGGDGGESTGEGEIEMSNPMHLTGHLDPKKPHAVAAFTLTGPKRAYLWWQHCQNRAQKHARRAPFILFDRCHDHRG